MLSIVSTTAKFGVFDWYNLYNNPKNASTKRIEDNPHINGNILEIIRDGSSSSGWEISIPYNFVFPTAFPSVYRQPYGTKDNHARLSESLFNILYNPIDLNMYITIQEKNITIKATPIVVIAALILLQSIFFKISAFGKFSIFEILDNTLLVILFSVKFISFWEEFLVMPCTISSIYGETIFCMKITPSF